MLKVRINNNDNDEILKVGINDNNKFIIKGCWKCELMIMVMMRFWRFGLVKIINNNK